MADSNGYPSRVDCPADKMIRNFTKIWYSRYARPIELHRSYINQTILIVPPSAISYNYHILHNTRLYRCILRVVWYYKGNHRTALSRTSTTIVSKIAYSRVIIWFRVYNIIEILFCQLADFISKQTRCVRGKFTFQIFDVNPDFNCIFIHIKTILHIPVRATALLPIAARLPGRIARSA